jgi:hypothetical protein
MTNYRNEIEPRPTALGGGVRLYLYGPDLETGEEIELGGVFPSGPGKPRSGLLITMPLRKGTHGWSRGPTLESRLSAVKCSPRIPLNVFMF